MASQPEPPAIAGLLHQGGEGLGGEARLAAEGRHREGQSLF